MPKITLIGAGSLVFTRNLCGDILLTPCLQHSEIALMDIDPQRLEESRQIVQKIVNERKLTARITASTDRAESVRNADYVITTFQQGGLEAYAQESFRREFKQIMVDPVRTDRTHEYGSSIIEAMETNQPIRINGNVPNRELIDNLPSGCCVEVPCLVDWNGVQPTHFGPLPPQLAALNRTNINVQELIVEAAVKRKRDAIYHAVALDPLTAAVCTLPQIHQMVDELLAAQEEWLGYLR